MCGCICVNVEFIIRVNMDLWLCGFVEMWNCGFIEMWICANFIVNKKTKNTDIIFVFFVSHVGFLL
nr:MAG TPA: hypothetical protein [Caudoviricetes sp.]